MSSPYLPALWERGSQDQPQGQSRQGSKRACRGGRDESLQPLLAQDSQGLCLLPHFGPGGQIEPAFGQGGQVELPRPLEPIPPSRLSKCFSD